MSGVEMPIMIDSLKKLIQYILSSQTGNNPNLEDNNDVDAQDVDAQTERDEITNESSASSTRPSSIILKLIIVACIITFSISGIGLLDDVNEHQWNYVEVVVGIVSIAVTLIVAVTFTPAGFQDVGPRDLAWGITILIALILLSFSTNGAFRSKPDALVETLPIPSVVASCVVVVAARSGANIRRMPDTDGNAPLTALSNGTQRTAIGKYIDEDGIEWFKIAHTYYENAWISGEVLDADPACSSLQTVPGWLAESRWDS